MGKLKNLGFLNARADHIQNQLQASTFTHDIRKNKN